MYIVIVGAGTFGEPLAKNAVEQGHDVVIVEKNRDRAQEISGNLDCKVLNGDATEPEIIEEARIEDADILVSTVSDDSVNVLVSLLAQDYDVSRVAAVATSERYENILDRLGVDVIINPQQIVSERMMDYISNPQIEDFLKLGDDKRVAVFEVNEGSVLAGVAISDIRSTQLPEEVLVVSILRGDEAIIPSGDSVINANDRVALMIRDSDLEKIEKVFES
jgi:trk system potassium uptake protein TrkA